jgi:putative transferase (TIGR04331 family)
VTIVWNAQRVSEGLDEIDSARASVLANVKHLLDEFHGVSYSARYYDIILGDWVERFLHLVYVAMQQPATNKSQTPKNVDVSDIHLFGDSAAFFANYPELPVIASEVIRSVIFKGPDSIAISTSAVSISNTFSMSPRERLAAGILRFIASRSFNSVLFVKPISGKVRLSWVATMFAWRKWARHDDLGFSFFSSTNPDVGWRRKNISPISSNSSLGDVANSIMTVFIPVCFVEGFQSIKEQVNRARPKRFAHIYSAQSLWTHFAFKVLAAEWCEQGTKLHYHQHGGWYGLDESHVGEIYESRVADFYYTWGWSRGGTNTKTLPPVMPNFRSQQKQFDSLICFDQPQQIYRLQYFPLPGTLQTMYDQTADFVRSRESVTELRIRLFPGEYGAQQKNAILKASSSAIFDNSQDIFSQYSSSRIVFHNYLGTSWLETLGNNIPTICFYDVDAYRFRSDAKPLLEDLVKVGVLHISGLSAAEKANAVESDVDSWWLSEEVQIARRNFVTQFANYSTDWKQIWRENFLEAIKVSELA